MSEKIPSSAATKSAPTEPRAATSSGLPVAAVVSPADLGDWNAEDADVYKRQRILILSALLLVCTAGLLHPRGRRLAGNYMRIISVALASVFIWMIFGAWLQSLEGGLNQNFTTRCV